VPEIAEDDVASKMTRALWLTVIASCLCAPAQIQAAGDEVIVIYNSRLPESKALASYYAEKRQVPAAQVFGFDLDTGEEISRPDYRIKFARPLAKKLEAAKLWTLGPGELPGTNGKPVRVAGKVLESKIRYAVLCRGVPIKILRDANDKDPGEETMRAEFRRNEAAVDSELACLPLINHHWPLAGPLGNPLYAATNGLAFHPTNGVLLVTRLDGPSPEIARGLVDKAMQAERDGLWGRAYFDLRGQVDSSFKQGEDWIRGAAEVAYQLGFETIVDTNADVFPPGFPMSQIAYYAGWYRETVAGPFTLPTVEFMPGAFAYHLHSFSGANLRTPNRNWVGPLLARGATITMGCVDEPYLGGTPDVAVFTARLIFFGFTFGEAAYAAQSTLSWQTTVVGDPLYRPFGKNPDEQHRELEQRRDKRSEWSHLRWANLHRARGAPLEEIVRFLEDLAATRESAVLTEKLADLYAAQGKPSSSVSTYQQALKLDPSPQQRIRLRLTLGERLMAANRDAEAYAHYRKFIEEVKDYPDRLAIHRKLLALAQKLGKREDAKMYDDLIRALAPN